MASLQGNYLRDLLLFVLGLFLTSRYVAKRRRSIGRPPLPPGPKGLPLIGSALSIDTTKPWATYVKWGETFGDLIYTRILNMDVLIINSGKIARDLLELRSTIYAGRPQLSTLVPYGLEFGTIFMEYGDTWRLHRRIYHQATNAEAAMAYRPMQVRKAREMVVNMVDDPQRHPTHAYTYSTSVIMSIVYGHEPAPSHDPLVELAEKGMEAIVKGARPETSALLSVFPFLLKLPEWIPGSLKAESTEAKRYSDDFRRIPFDIVREQMAAGTDAPSMISNGLRRNWGKDDPDVVAEEIKNTAAVAFGAASDTTAFSLQIFVLAMVLFPEAQRKAQKEIDAVVGHNRLPNFDDRPSLPYVEAVMRESLRWHPVAPLVPHATTAEDVYEGKYIPKGTTVLLNAWAIAHDESAYPEPFEFKPERWLREDGELTEDNVPFAFGYGRRVCPGKHVGEASLWISMVSMLAALDFLKDKDEAGNDIDFEPKFTAEVTSRPETYPCRIVPRRSASETKRIAMQEDADDLL
ncbi:hypothetical protein HYDPIDRAFT_25543 [Hydnomerulius pinastri MD-312]|nr:hypothetical protein HYDPIDRAFT_25543 [Hydnomerulius pinastri MD-312]